MTKFWDIFACVAFLIFMLGFFDMFGYTWWHLISDLTK